MKGVHLGVLREDPRCFICLQWGGNRAWSGSFDLVQVLWRCHSHQGIGSIATLRGLTLILKFLSQYGVNFKCKATVQLFHPCTGADFHLSGPWNLLVSFISMLQSFLRLQSETDLSGDTNERLKCRDLHTKHRWKKKRVFFSYYDLDSPRYSLHIFLTPTDSVRFLVLMSLRRGVLPVFMPFPIRSVCKAWLSD